jgi:hypothetical protein
MSANPLPETMPQPAVPADDLEARVRELAAKYPVPGAQDVRGWVVDREWLAEQQLKGAFDAYYGKVVAVYNKELIGVGDNYYEMLLELSPKYNVHPERIVGVYLGDGGEMRWSYENSPATTAPLEPEFGPNPKIQAQVAELRELEKQFPVPTWDEVKGDWEWFYAQGGKPEMEPYYYQLVAVYNKQVVGSDPQDELALRIRLSKQYQIHPERFVVSFCG